MTPLKRRGARWRLVRGGGLAVLLQSALTHPAIGQAIPKPEYVTYLPREIVLPVQATPANRQFHSAYRDLLSHGAEGVPESPRISGDRRGDVTVYSHNLGLENKEGSFVVAQDAHVTRIHLGLGTTLSF